MDATRSEGPGTRKGDNKTGQIEKPPMILTEPILTIPSPEYEESRPGRTDFGKRPWPD